MSNFVPRVGRHVAYLRTIDTDTEPHPPYLASYVKRRPATIVAVGSNSVDIRVGHHGEEYTGILIRTAHGQQEVYVPY